MEIYNHISKTIGKYAIILIVLYFFENFLSDILIVFLTNLRYYPDQMVFITIVNSVVFIFSNLIVALFIASDIKKYKLKTKYIILLTILFRPIGVCFFLISLILEKKIKNEQPTYNSGSNLSGVFGGFQTNQYLQTLLTGDRETGRKSPPKLNRGSLQVIPFLGVTEKVW